MAGLPTVSVVLPVRDDARMLAGCLDALQRELLSGEARFRTYRQFKMYNDPELNPAVRGARGDRTGSAS